MSKHNSGVYRIEIGPNYYYGMSVDLSARERMHAWTLRTGRHLNQYMQRSYDKYGDFEFRTLAYCDGDYMVRLEASLIKQHIDDSRCMNLILEDGTGSRSMSDETRRKITEAQRNRPPHKEALRRHRISEANRLRPVEDELERRRRIADGNRGQRRTPEQRKRIADSIRGVPKRAAWRPVVFYGPSGEEFYFPNPSFVSEYFGISSAGIYSRLNGNLKWSRRGRMAGWVGKYLDEGVV